MVFYLTFSFCYLVYHKVQFLLLWFSQCIPVLLELLRNNMGSNITSMLMTHSYIYHWILTMKNLEHCIADILLWMTKHLLRLNGNKQILYIWHHHILLHP